MSHMDEKVVPKREDRLQANNAYGGKVCQLVKDSKAGCLVNKDRGFSQTCNCQLGLSLAMVHTLPDTVIIVHGPVGCASSSHGSDSYHRAGLTNRGLPAEPLRWISSNLEERDIINGGAQKLEEAIIEADRTHRPAAIVIVTTCAPGIIGDDIDEVASRIQPQVAARIIPVHCEGFKTKISATAYDAVYHGIGRNLPLSPERTELVLPDPLADLAEQYRQGKTVNIFNVFSIGRADELELERLLGNLGLKAAFYPNFAHPDQFRALSQAALNVSLCPTHDDYFLEFLKERFGTPYILNTMPIGIRNTREWLLDIARVFGLETEAERIAAVEEAELNRSLSRYRDGLQGKKVFLSGGEIRAAATAMLMQELGCEIAGIRGHHYDRFGDELYLKTAALSPDLNVNIATTQVFELVNLLRRARPDLFLGHSGSNVWAAKLGIPSLPIFSQTQYYLGYRGVFEVARRAVKLLGNTAFQRRLQSNTALPFKPEWYDRDPFSYIKN